MRSVRCQYLFEILQASTNIKNSESVVKSGFLGRTLRWGAIILFPNEGGMWKLFCKNINILLNY